MKGLLSRAVTAALDRIVDTSLPPISQQEALRVAELRAALSRLAPRGPEGLPPPEARWSEYARRLRELAETRDPREFLRWDVVSQTMFIGNALFIRHELNYLRRRPDWRSRWRNAVGESRIGRPTPYVLYPRSSGNLLHHAYHLARFEETTGCRVDRLDLVVEFGGGYGSMCRLLHNLGFRGIYLGYDLPEFCALQRFYLRSLGIRELEAHEMKTGGPGGLFVSDLDHLRRLAAALPAGAQARSMLIATWSISETSVEFRERFFDAAPWPAYHLLAFQDRFRDVDNVTYFHHFVASRPTSDWSVEEIGHRPLSRYLFGRSRGSG